MPRSCALPWYGFVKSRTILQLIYGVRSTIALACCLMPLLVCVPAQAQEPKQVMLLYSFGKDFKPWSAYATSIRAELNRQSPWPLDITENSLVTARSGDEDPETPFVE